MVRKNDKVDYGQFKYEVVSILWLPKIVTATSICVKLSLWTGRKL